MPKRVKDGLAKVLHDARAAAALTLRGVERSTGISNAYLSQLETGKTTNPSPHILAKLATAYGVPYSNLMSAAGYPEVLDPAPAVRRIAMLAAELDGDEQERVADFISRLRAQRKRFVSSD